MEDNDNNMTLSNTNNLIEDIRNKHDIIRLCLQKVPLSRLDDKSKFNTDYYNCLTMFVKLHREYVGISTKNNL